MKLFQDSDVFVFFLLVAKMTDWPLDLWHLSAHSCSNLFFARDFFFPRSSLTNFWMQWNLLALAGNHNGGGFGIVYFMSFPAQLLVKSQDSTVVSVTAHPASHLTMLRFLLWDLWPQQLIMDIWVICIIISIIITGVDMYAFWGIIFLIYGKLCE